MRWLALVPVTLALAAQAPRAAPAARAEPAERSFEVWHGSRPSAWTLLTAPPKPEPAPSAPPMTLSDEVSGSKPALWSLLRGFPGAVPAAPPAEPSAPFCPGTKRVAASLSMNAC